MLLMCLYICFGVVVTVPYYLRNLSLRRILLNQKFEGSNPTECTLFYLFTLYTSNVKCKIVLSN